MSTRSRRPSIAELRAVTQPPSIFARNSGEHWIGRLYMRRLSPYLTRVLLALRVSPNGATWMMIATGPIAAALLTLPGIVPVVGAVLVLQLQIALDCSDGELARWLDRKSPAGVYLDRVGHWLTEATLPVGLGIRADGGWDSIGTYTTLGLCAAILALLIMTQSALVVVARAEAGLPLVEDSAAIAAPRRRGLAMIRGLVGKAPFYRVFVAQEFSFLALIAAIGDAAFDTLDVTRALIYVLLAAGVVTVTGRMVAILSSSRLR
jgi:phosphatidylglycerophosphate synthase